MINSWLHTASSRVLLALVLAALVGACASGGDETDAMVIGINLKDGKYTGGLAYVSTGMNSMEDAINDSDFAINGVGVDVEGFILRVNYTLSNAETVSFTYRSVETRDGTVTDEAESIQLSYDIKF